MLLGGQRCDAHRATAWRACCGQSWQLHGEGSNLNLEFGNLESRVSKVFCIRYSTCASTTCMVCRVVPITFDVYSLCVNRATTLADLFGIVRVPGNSQLRCLKLFLGYSNSAGHFPILAAWTPPPPLGDVGHDRQQAS